jgi:PAS domain S-box-containing protein
MRKPDFPADEQRRLQALRDLELLDTPAEERFDRLTRIAQSVFRTPIALVSLVDADRQWFKSRQGLDATQTPRDISFCGHAILGDEVFYIPNALEDPRFADNPLVAGAPDIRFYAGAPLASPDGHKLGTLCVIDNKPHQHSAEELQLLRDLAQCVEQEFRQLRVSRAAHTLGEHGSYLNAVLETVIDGIITIDERGLMQTVNPAAEEIFGYDAAEMLGRNVNLLMPEPYAGAHDAYLRSYLQSGQARVIGIGREVQGRRKDGSTFPMELAVSEMAEAGQRNFVGIVRDISERKQAARSLEESSRLRQAILDSANFSIISTDTEGVIQTFNRGAEQMLGYTEAELAGTETPALIQ